MKEIWHVYEFCNVSVNKVLIVNTVLKNCVLMRVYANRTVNFLYNGGF